MKKIPSLFARNPENPRVLTRDYHALASWVLAGEGTATRKWDGTAVLMVDGVPWARYDAKRGKEPPAGFMPAQDPDPVTGHHPGWVLATRPEDKWIREATASAHALLETPWKYAGQPVQSTWTYEACGPKIGGNREALDTHILFPHGFDLLGDVPLGFDDLVEFFRTRDIEGVVWWRDRNDLHCDKVKITGAALGVVRRTPDR